MLRIRTNKLPILVIFLGVLFAVNFLFLGTKVSAQSLNDSQVNAKAEKFCGDGAIGTAEAACRNGFRRGYDNEAIAAACNNRTDYNAAEKTGCRKGHAEGKTLKASGSASSISFNSTTATGTHPPCGSGPSAIQTKFNFGCRGQGNPIFDVLFAIIRFLTFGVGLVIVIAIILAGIKYSSSEGNPEATMAAKQQIQNAIIGLLVYLFSFAILNFLIPGGLLG